MFEEYPPILKVNDVCNILDIERHSVYKLMQNGELDFFKANKTDWRITKNSLISYILRLSDLDSNNLYSDYIFVNNSCPDIMTVDEVSEYLNISKPTCLNLLKDGRIAGFKINNSRQWKICKPSLDKYIQSVVKNNYIIPIRFIKN